MKSIDFKHLGSITNEFEYKALINFFKTNNSLDDFKNIRSHFNDSLEFNVSRIASFFYLIKCIKEIHPVRNKDFEIFLISSFKLFGLNCEHFYFKHRDFTNFIDFFVNNDEAFSVLLESMPHCDDDCDLNGVWNLVSSLRHKKSLSS